MVILGYCIITFLKLNIKAVESRLFFIELHCYIRFSAANVCEFLQFEHIILQAQTVFFVALHSTSMTHPPLTVITSGTG